MFDTPVTVMGNVLTAPEWRRTTITGTFVVTFKVASTSRRFDKERGQWVDGDSLRVRVVCWRRLGENVSVSVQLGDPVVVHGRLYSRDWTDRRPGQPAHLLRAGRHLGRPRPGQGRGQVRPAQGGRLDRHGQRPGRCGGGRR
jgi:single-strand DNA-binding protein